jgi:hypothetical protein
LRNKVAKASLAPPRITRSCRFAPIAVIVDQDDTTPDNANPVEKNTNKSDGDDDKEEKDDNTTHNAKFGSNPPCDWEGVKCYCLGIRPSMCH